MFRHRSSRPNVYHLTLRRTRKGGWMPPPPHKVFLEFLQDELLSRPAAFSSCAYIPKTHFDISLVRIGSVLWLRYITS